MLTWESDNPPLGDEIITAAELILGVSLPDTYKDLAKKFPGGYPDLADFAVKRGERTWGSCVGALLSLDPRHSGNVYQHLRGQGSKHGLPERVIPIADDGGGDLLCLDYRAGGSNPRVVYWAHDLGHEEGIVDMAESFDAFLDLLERQDDV